MNEFRQRNGRHVRITGRSLWGNERVFATAIRSFGSRYQLGESVPPMHLNSQSG